MDFRRRAIVLIVCFFFLNVFLFGLVWQKKVESKTPLNSSINVIDQMKQDGITLPSLPSTDETAPIIQLTPVSIGPGLNNLQNQSVTLEKNVITAELLPPIQLGLSTPINEESFNALTNFINNKVLFGDKYVWSSYNATTRKVIYAQKADKLSIMDGTSQIIVTLNANDHAVSYEQTYAGNVQVLGNKRSLITAQSAVEVLFLAGKIPAKSIVSTVKSYFQSLVLKEFSIYSPAWYVEIRQADGQLVARRVDAIHGTVLTNETLETTNTQTQRTTPNNTTTQTVQQQ